MNNQYIYFPNLEIDLDQIQEIVTRNMWKPVTGLATHQRHVADEPYLKMLKEKYQFFSSLYNIYTTPANYKVPIHICPDRGCALNIPIIYTENSHTIFYEMDETKKEYNRPRIYDIMQSDAKEVFRFTLDRPTLMNTLLPHSVIGGPLRARTIMSWSILTGYEETKQLMGML
jgi:hypothetical protein